MPEASPNSRPALRCSDPYGTLATSGLLGAMMSAGEGLAELGQGALLSAAVDGGGVEPHGAQSDGHTHETACLNCGTGLIGSHCHVCGQAAHVHRTLGAFFHDLLHGVFHFEGRVWRTLPLLVLHPGRLTRQYIAGKRASYVSPIALFLFFVFVMFAVFHAVEDHEGGHATAAVSDPSAIEKAISTSELKLGQLKAERGRLIAAGRDTDQIDKQIDNAQDGLDVLHGTRDALSDKGGNLVASGTSISQLDKTLRPRIVGAIRKFQSNPDLAIYKIQTYAYKYSWALIPISVPFLWLLFPFSRRYHLYDHTVFVTYSLCFMTLLVIVAMLCSAIGWGGLVGVLVFLPPLHMYRQLRGAYLVSRWGALWRTGMLVWFAAMALTLFFVMIMAQTSF